ncbi:eukaryotic translation initiation factor 2C, 2 [Thoreauomyces humboldtii]|nr:eukaryotic translation initiation factor 2C, 2 [Thoreauomyces humboldtii]
MSQRPSTSGLHPDAPEFIPASATTTPPPVIAAHAERSDDLIDFDDHILQQQHQQQQAWPELSVLPLNRASQKKNHDTLGFEFMRISGKDSKDRRSTRPKEGNSRAPCPLPRPSRPNVGQRGRLITLKANFYRLKFPDIRIHHYDVEVHPNEMAQINRKVMEVWKRLPRSPKQAAIAAAAVYDGRKNLFMPQAFPLTSETTIRGKTRAEQTFEIDLPEEEVVEAMGAHPTAHGPQRYKLRIRKVSEIDMERLHKFLAGVTAEFPRETVMVLEVMLRHKPTLLLESGGTGGGFYTPQGASNIRGGLAIHPGWYQSIRPTAGQLLFNLDLSATTFYQTGPLVAVVARFFQRDAIEQVRWDNDRDIQRLDKFLRDVSIEITYRPTGRRRYKIRAITPKSAIHTYIAVGQGTSISYVSVQQYFREQYNIRLQFPHLPCVASGAQLDIIIPMELCRVRENQRHTGRLNERQAADMIRITALLPRNRSMRIENGKQIMHSDEAHLAAWGVELEPQMMEIPGRILPPPQLSFQAFPESPVLTLGQERLEDIHTRVTEIPDTGTWKVEGPLKFAEGASLRYWSVAVFGDQRELPVETIQAFVLMLISAMEDKGMTIHNQRPDIVYGPVKAEVAATLRLAAERARYTSGIFADEGVTATAADVQLVICIITHKHTVYNDIKRIAETEMGPMTQCAMSRQAMKLDAGYIGNLILKLNVKLGGTNVYMDPTDQLTCLGEPMSTMLFGADVTHPPPGTVEGRSIAAVVASMDARFCEYRASIRIQGSRQEIITDLCVMACELLDLFYERAMCYPKRVVFYRDGVSEGQFSEVAIQEILALKKALEIKGVPDAKVTFLVVNKRHHTRVFPVDEGQAAAGNPIMDPKGNVLPGTVVDSDICHPHDFDFYLTSHAGLQGTSKPAHYHVLYDETHFAADDIQEFTYRLCYLFARSSRAVSIVPPAYYAHLVAARARCHAASAETSGGGEGDQRRKPRRKIGVLEIAKVSEALQKKMYFT